MINMIGHIIGGKLVYDKKTIEATPDCDVEIKVLKNNRSTQQNKYYWGVVVDLISDHTGYTPEEVHEIIKYKFLTEYFHYHESNEHTALVYEIPKTKSTTGLKSNEFEDLMSQIREWASLKLGVYIPDPNEGNINV